jgi:hypothetical protein
MKQYIGGEFELNTLDWLEIPNNLTNNLPGSWTINGRSAFSALLSLLKKQKTIKKVLIPAYLCPSVIQPLKELSIDYDFYPVNEKLEALPDVKKGLAVLLIHYFGWINPATEKLRSEANENFFLIEDMSHAVLSEWKLGQNNKSHIFLSLRKFAPIPLGGWFNSEKIGLDSNDYYNSLFWKSISIRFFKYLYLNSSQTDLNIENKYIDLFNSIEKIFDNNSYPYALEKEGKSLINNFDWNQIGIKRINNWNYLNKLMPQFVTPFHKNLPENVIPLGYVIQSDQRDEIREKLMEANIFCPVHWRLPEGISKKRFPLSHKLTSSLLTIPIDQRYDVTDMEYIISKIK